MGFAASASLGTRMVGEKSSYWVDRNSKLYPGPTAGYDHQRDWCRWSSRTQCCKLRGRRSGGWLPYHRMQALSPRRTSMVASNIHRLDAAAAATGSTET